jgi:hypothetical protein
MISDGIARLQSVPAVKAIAKVGGGFATDLPKGHDLPSWTYALRDTASVQTSGRQEPLTEGWLEIDCYGTSASDAELLREAIDAALRATAGGRLQDADATPLLMYESAFVSPDLDDASRTYRRKIRAHIWFRRN